MLLTVSLVFNVLFVFRSWRQSTVVSVPDGDSLQLADGRRVRLLSADAPERGRCLADAARSRLSELALGRHVLLSDRVTDDYGRILAYVQAVIPLPSLLHEPSGVTGFRYGIMPVIDLNLALVTEGLARYTSSGRTHKDTLARAYAEARDRKIGIFSPICRPLSPPTPDQVIKGNVRAGRRTYFLPACRNYDDTEIDLSAGDQWFRSESEAQDAGFSRSPTCP